MANTVLSEQAGISAVHAQVTGHIGTLRRINTYIQNVGESALAAWDGKNAVAFETFLKEVYVVGAALIDEAEIMNQRVLDSAHSFTNEDQAIAGNYER